MIKIIDDSIANFHKDVEESRLYLFGAGRKAIHFYEEFGLSGRITAIIDNDQRQWNQCMNLGKENIPVISVQGFLEQIKGEELSEILLLISPSFYAWKIVEQLDRIPELDGLSCYIGELLTEYYENQDFSFTVGERKIPKKIHYCWFGGKEIPSKLQRYIDGWRVKCPDYEIIRWDESNYDISQNRYMKEAYECKKWGFVPDYARLDIIYREGGIYLDTDIELLMSLDKLLCDDMFCGALNNVAINFGQGFGAVPGHPLMRALRDVYDDKSFYREDGSVNLTPCYVYQHPELKKFGFEIKNQYQKINGVVIYPSEVSAPMGTRGIQNHFTKNTVMNHHSELSWISDEERKNMEEYKTHIVHRKLYRGGGNLFMV